MRILQQKQKRKLYPAMEYRRKSSKQTNLPFREKYVTQILNALPGMLLIVDYNGVIVELVSSPTTVFFDHISPEALISSHFKDILPPEAYGKFEETMKHVLATGKTSRDQHKIIIKGISKYFENTVSILNEEHLLCVWYDVTERVHTYQEMKIMENALHKAKEGIAATTIDGYFLFANEHFKSLFNLPGEIDKYHASDILSDGLLFLWKNMIKQLRLGQAADKYLFPVSENNSSNEFYEVYANLQTDQYGKELVWYFLRDITLRIQHERKISRLDTLMKGILDNIPICLFVKDSGDDFRYIYWNKAFAEFSGISEKETIGKNDFEVFGYTQEMSLHHMDDLEALKKGFVSFERETFSGNGEKKFVSLIKTRIYLQEESPYVLGVMWDITDIRKAQKEQIDARHKAEKADRMKSAFLANMSHEIRTPLNAIVGFSRLIIETKDENEKKAYADIIDQNTKNLLNLFNDILDLAAIESDTLPMNYTQVSLYELCLNQYSSHKHIIGEKVEFFFDDSDEELIIRTDWNRISQILKNLINNAIKFTRTGEIHFGYKQINDLIQFYVKDTGIGISADKMETIFQRFGQVNTFVQGTGLGLTICRTLVDKMGGQLWARSQENEGTTFFFTLPFENI